MASSQRSSRGFFIKESGENTFSHEPQQFRMMVRSGGSISIIFVFLERFAWLCENFAWSCEIQKHVFRLLFAISLISSFLIHLHHLQFSSKAWSKPIILLLSLCIWIIINFICFLQFDSSLLTQIYQNHTLKWLQNFIKLVSNSCKGKNMLIECFRHNYYSKDVKLMRIII